MKLTIVATTLLATAVSARDFTVYVEANYGGARNRDMRDNDNACCMWSTSPQFSIR